MSLSRRDFFRRLASKETLRQVAGMVSPVAGLLGMAREESADQAGRDLSSHSNIRKSPPPLLSRKIDQPAAKDHPDKDST